MTSNFFGSPLVIDSDNLPFILTRLKADEFSRIKALTSTYVDQFKKILHDFFSSKISYREACKRTGQEIIPPVYYKPVKRWAERLFRTEASKIFTLGYGDYLLSIGETLCLIPHTKLDESEECLQLIAGKEFPIKMIQDNIYKNYNLKKPIFPTVPLHANCRHIITKIPRKPAT